MEDLPIGTIVAIWGFVAGIAFGAIANKTNFCTMGGVSDMVLMGETNRFRAWMLATGVAILGTQLLHHYELVDLTLGAQDAGPIYLTANLGWPGAILGGLMFGFGMTRGGGCGNKTLVRIGGGNLKSVVVFLVMAVTAYMTLRGLIGLARLELEAFNTDLSEFGLTSQSIVEMVAVMVGSDMEALRLPVTGIVFALFAGYCFKSAEFRSSFVDIFAGVSIGLLVVLGWYITGSAEIGHSDDFELTQMFSFTFVNPSAESVQYLMTFTGASINFGIAAVGGVIVGSFLMAIATKSFHWEAFNGVQDMGSTMWGAVLMGIGGVLALGCTIGQGITGMSTLALGSLIALVSIVIGAMWGMKALEEGSVIGGLKNVFSRN